MDAFFLYLFIILCFVLIIQTIIKPSLILEYPYFVGSIFFIFLAPQAVIIFNQPHLIPRNTSAGLFAMCFLCLLMVALGYRFAPMIKFGSNLNVKLNFTKLRLIGIVYTVLGYLFLFLIYRNLDSVKGSTQWSGILTIYFQLFQVINIAFPILLYLAFNRPSFNNIVLAVIAALPSLYLILFAGRREVTALFFLTIAFTFYYKRRIVPPRAAIVGIILFTMLIIPATGDYRGMAARLGPAKAFSSLNLQKSFINYYNEGKYLELEVAGHIIDSYSFNGNFQYGGGYWDEMVFRYVPAQLLGKKFKKSLMFNDNDIVFRNGYKIYTGLTITGVGDSFIQFGYFGCIFFFFIAGFFKYLWKFSLSSQNPLVQIFYMICVVQALLSVTHATINFMPGIFFSFLCLWGASLFAKDKSEELTTATSKKHLVNYI